MKRKLLFLSLFFGVLQSTGQITFERQDYVTGINTCCPYSKVILETPDHGYVSAGKIAEGLVTYYYWEKIDSSGHYLWSYEFAGFTFGDAGIKAASLTYDGGLILCGNCFVSIFPMGIIKTNSNGIIEWSKIIGIQGMDFYGNSVLQTKDGGYIVAGSRNGMGSWDGKLIKLDSTGALLWSKAYSGSQFEAIDFKDIIETDDSGFIAVGKAFSPSVGSHVIILRTDLNGDTIWTKQYASTTTEIEATSISQTFDSCYVISGSENSTPFPGSFLFKINSLGDTLWKREFGYGDSLIINNVEQVSDSGLILSATRDYYYGLIIKTNSSGNILWTKELNLNYRSECVIQTSDFGFAIAGGPGFSVVRTDSLGNTYCTSIITNVMTSMRGMSQFYSNINITNDTLIFPLIGSAGPLQDIQDNILCYSLGKTETGFETLTVDAYPNPSDKLLFIRSTLKISSFEIYNLMGIMVHESHFDNMSEFEIDITDLSPSIYFIKLYSKEGVATLKFLKN